ncbi:MAG: DNA-binding domain-containing protein [Kiritimatiellia bacterium]
MADIINDTKPAIESINYRVVRNGAISQKQGKDVFSGVVDLKETYNITDLAKRMVSEGCAVKNPTIRMVLTDFAELVGKLTAEGRAINIGGVVRFAPSVRGTFGSQNAAWDATKNRVFVNATAGSKLRMAATSSTVVRTEMARPQVELLINGITGELNTLTIGGSGFLSGKRLNFRAGVEDEGVFLAIAGVMMHCSTEGATDQSVKFTCPEGLEDGATGNVILRTRLGDESLPIPYQAMSDVFTVRAK